MEQLNSITSRSVSAAQNMQALEKAIFAADIRVRVRADQTVKAKLLLGTVIMVPFGIYWIHGMVAPYGFMQNFKASNGCYAYWA